jgi:ABC-type uncharacterized transport system fused permease/ATPase subunit
MFKQSLSLFRRALAHEPSNKRNLLYAITLEIISVALLYFPNGQYGALYDGISNYNPQKIYTSMLNFAGLAGLLVFVGGITTFVLNRLAFSIREGLNNYYTVKIAGLQHIENIEQRIQEDLKNFGERSVEFWFAILKSALKLPIFVGIVVSLTQWWVGVVLILSVVLGTLATKVFAKKLIALQVTQESNEANYRKGVKYSLFKEFQSIKYSFNLINTQVKKLSFLQSGLGQTFVLLPFVILIPLYLSKAITMGILMQAANAMGNVINSLTVLIEQRQLIVNISTCLTRMETLDKPDIKEEIKEAA